MWLYSLLYFFFFNDTATTEIYTLSLHDALPISLTEVTFFRVHTFSRERDNEEVVERTMQREQKDTKEYCLKGDAHVFWGDRKSTRLNSSHQIISYAVFCLKKKKNHISKLKQYTI